MSVFASGDENEKTIWTLSRRGYSAEQIAQKTGLSIGAVKQVLTTKQGNPLKSTKRRRPV